VETKNNTRLSLSPKYYIGLLLAISAFSLSGRTSENVADKIIGNWISPNKDLIVRCYKGTNGKYHGKMAWFKVYSGDASRYNCDIPQKEWINKVVLTGFTYQNKEWANGTIKDLKKCNTYDAYIKLETDGRLTATGFVVFRWLSESMTFSRYIGALPKQE
jgi:uncharacterized protein (DUF2147 family)